MYVLLYANDTIIMAGNEHDLQTSLNSLNAYCKKWNLQVWLKPKLLFFFSSKLPTDIVCQLHETCVIPVLLYGCEIWEFEI